MPHLFLLSFWASCLRTHNCSGDMDENDLTFKCDELYTTLARSGESPRTLNQCSCKTGTSWIWHWMTYDIWLILDVSTKYDADMNSMKDDWVWITLITDFDANSVERPGLPQTENFPLSELKGFQRMQWLIITPCLLWEIGIAYLRVSQWFYIVKCYLSVIVNWIWRIADVFWFIFLRTLAWSAF